VYYSVNQTNEDKMGGAYRTHGGKREMPARFSLRYPKKRYHLEDRDFGGGKRLIL
jgi:hypothetical protein